MITTKKVKLLPKELFSILLTRYIRKKWWLFAWIWLMVILMWLLGDNGEVEFFFTIFAIILPIILVLQFWRYVTSKDNKIMLLERHYEIDNEKINCIIDKDTYSPVKLEHFIKVEIIKNYYLLYLSKQQFIYIPIDSFENQPDLDWFKTEIVSAIRH